MKGKIVFLILAGMLFVNPLNAATCNGGTEITGTQNNHVYCISNNALNWFVSMTWCQSQGRHLATIYEACTTDVDTSKPIPSSCPNLNVGKNVWGWLNSNTGKANAYFVKLNENGIHNFPRLTSANASIFVALCY